MKALSELGISPWPWKADEEGWVDDVNGVQVITNAGALVSLRDTKKNPDARLIAAAPELYEALRKMQECFDYIRSTAWFMDASFGSIRKMTIAQNEAQNALAKASGE